MRQFFPSISCGSAIGRVTFAALSLLLSADSVVAIQINMVWGGGTAPFDTNGSKLQAIADDAANIWEDIFEDSHTVTITYRYSSIDSSTTLANGTATTISGGRPTAGTINIDNSSRTWFFDTTPLSNGEYELDSTVYQDLDSGDKSAWFNNSPPSVLEVGYRGSALSTAPAEAQNGYDMLSTFVHEIGHVLGLSHNSMARAEVHNDPGFDFDVPGVLNGGNGFGILADGSDIDEVNEWAHVASREALMCNGCGDTGLRRLPSATDIFAIASAANSSTAGIDLPRKDFLGGTTWATATNWSGNRIPDASDEVYIRTGGNPQISFSANTSVGTMHVEYGSHRFAMGTRTLTSNGVIYVDKTGTMTVTSGTLVATNRLRVGETLDLDPVAGRFEMRTGSRVVVRDDTTTALLVGQNGYGVFDQLGGTLEITPQVAGANTHAYFGNLSGSKGTYNFSGGDATFSDTVYVGNQGTGIVNHSGSADAIIGEHLIIGNGADSHGEYHKTGGTLNITSDMWVGARNSGLFEQSVGTSTANSIAVGRYEGLGNIGTLSLSGGILESRINMIVGYGGQGDFTITGGDASTRTGSLYLGFDSTGVGTVRLSEASGQTAKLAINQAIVVGQSGVGSVTMSAGTISAGVDLVVGNNTGSNGNSFVNNGGTLDIGRHMIVGFAGQGAFEQSAGTTTANVDISVGDSVGGTGTLLLTGGTLNANDDFVAGYRGKGTATITGGNVNVANRLFVGLEGTGAKGELIQSGTSTIRIENDLRIADLIGSEGTYRLGGGTLDVSSGQIRFGQGTGNFEFAGGTLHVGTYNGNLANEGGILAPGNSAGRTIVNGNYGQLPTASLEIEIGGLAAGLSFDDVVVNGSAELAGLLDVSLISDFTPSIGQQFTVLTATGGILNNGLALAGSAASMFQLLINNSSLILQAVAPGLPGDFNDDGAVDAADYVVWRDTNGTAEQYAEWRAHFGGGSGSGGPCPGPLCNVGTGASVDSLAGAGPLSNVPEPSGFLLVAITGCVGFSVRRRNAPLTLLMAMSFFVASGSVTAATPAGCAGDYNDDGVCTDAADYVVWRNNVGTASILVNDPNGPPIGALQYNQWRARFGLEMPSGFAGAAAAGLSCDYNGDGVCDAADYTTWRDGLGPVYKQTDYETWRTGFGSTVAGTSAFASSQSAVPEPSTGLLILLGAAAAMTCRRARLCNLVEVRQSS